MQMIKKIYLSFIKIFSEIIWIYYTIVMFTSVEWEHSVFFDLKWFFVAGIMGFAFNTLLEKMNNRVIKFLTNILVIGLLVIQNWINVVPQGIWLFGLVVSIGLSFIYIRSIKLIHQQPTRGEILRRFEGNIILYIVFAVIFTLNNWSNDTFHLFFMFAILNSLMGMVLTLQNLEEEEGNQIAEIMKVGKPGWFAGAMTILLVCIPLFSLTLLLPSVNRAFNSLVITFWGGLKWVAVKIYIILVWFFSLFPEPEIKPIPDIPTDKMFVPPQGAEETFVSLSYIWLIGALSILIIVIVMWFFSRIIKNRKIPKTMKPKHIIIKNESFWVNFKRRLKILFKELKLKWLMKFPYFYYHSIYWYYNQVIKWGKKNGLPKLKSETSQEYVNKLIAKLPEIETNFSHKNQNYYIPKILSNLNRDYQATYYGPGEKINDEGEYKLLISHLNRIRLNRRV